MIKSIYKKISGASLGNSINSAALLIAGAGFLSRILGLVRDRIFAARFGAGDTLDVYYAAFRLPDLIYNLLILGALSAAFIPIYSSFLAKKEEDGAQQFASKVLSAGVLGLAAISLTLSVFAPWIIKLITPGFSPEKASEVVRLTRIMFLSPIFIGISGVFGGILNSRKKFLVYSLSPSLYNIGIIVGALFFVDILGNITGLAWGVALGALLHMAVQIPAILSTGFRFQFAFEPGDRHMRKLFRLMIPRTLGLAATQINLLVITIIASLLASGSLAIFNFANNLQSVALGIFGIPFALAAFPALSHAAAQKDYTSFRNDFSQTFRFILYLVIPVSVLILVFRAQIVRVALGAGKFDWNDTILTFQCLGLFSLSLFAQSTLPLLTRAFYALQNTRTPFFSSLIAEFLNFILAIYLSMRFGVVGLAVAFSVSGIVNMFLLIFLLRLEMEELDDFRIISTTLKIAVSAILAGIIAQLVKQIPFSFLNLSTFWGISGQLLIGIFVGISSYLLFTRALRLEEFERMKHLLKFRFIRWKTSLPEDPTEASGI